ncbi:MAG: hypothetical protein ABJB34_07860 [Acidobacteriota bacterium]
MSKQLIQTLATLLLFLAGLSQVWSQESASPAAVTDGFYKNYIAFQMRELPTDAQVKTLAPHFSRDRSFDRVISDILYKR